MKFGHSVPEEERLLPKNVLTRSEIHKENLGLYKRMVASERRAGAGRLQPYVINRPKARLPPIETE